MVQGQGLWVWSATSRGRPPDRGLALAIFHMVPRVPATLNLVAQRINVGARINVGVFACSPPVCEAVQTRRARRGGEQDVVDISIRMYEKIHA